MGRKTKMDEGEKKEIESLECKIGELESVVGDALADFEEASKIFCDKKSRYEDIKENIKDARYEILKIKHPQPALPKHETIEEHPDAEELLKLKKLMGYRTRTEFFLTPVCEGILKLEGYQFDIEMPTSPWYVGHLVMKNGEYHFTEDHVWRLDVEDGDLYKEDIEGKIVLTDGEYEFKKESIPTLEVFYRREVEEGVPEELLFGGAHKE